VTVVPLDRLPAAAAGNDVPLAAGPTATAASTPADAFARAFGDALSTASAALERADAAEHAFAARRGGLQEMVVERARADVMLSLAGAAATRTAQALSTILGMQV
jgi:flagellar hook-basal body complex protein FliE